MAFNTSYNHVTNREDLTSKIVSKGDQTTTLLSSLEMVKKEKVTKIKHEWSEFTVRAGADNAQVENFTPSTSSVVPVRVYNYVQRFSTSFGISNTQLEVNNVAAIKNLFSWTADQQFLALRKDINYTLINSVASVSGAAATASRMLGMFGAVTTNTSTPAATTSVFTESEFINMAKQVVIATGETRDLSCHTGAVNVGRITDFTGVGKTQYVQEGSTGKHNRLVNLLLTNFGNIKIVTDTAVGDSQIGMFDFNTWALAYARTPKLAKLPEATDGKSSYWVTELTLEYLHEAANAKMTGIATS